MPQYKERGSNLDKCLSPYNLSKTHLPPFIYITAKLLLISWFFIMAFNFGFVSGHILERQVMHAV